METKESVTIRREHPASSVACQLIAELDAYLGPLYPKESQHGYSVEKLVSQRVEFFLLYDHGKPAGCAGVQFFDGDNERDSPYGELKRMYDAPMDVKLRDRALWRSSARPRRLRERHSA